MSYFTSYKQGNHFLDIVPYLEKVWKHSGHSSAYKSYDGAPS